MELQLQTAKHFYHFARLSIVHPEIERSIPIQKRLPNIRTYFIPIIASFKAASSLVNARSSLPSGSTG